MTPRKRVVALISGRGSNLAALVTAANENGYPAQIVGVISDNPEAAGLTFAASQGITTRIVERKDHASKDAHDAAIDAALRSLSPDVVVLAGYMRLLTQDFVRKWEGKLINIHPSLLPLFKGLHSHRRALESGVRIHGCTVHFVTYETDGGPIIGQAAVPVLIDDTEDTLSQRVLKAEHRLYPVALDLVARGRVRMEEGRTVFDVAGAAELNQGQSVLAPELTDDLRSLEDLARFTP